MLSCFLNKLKKKIAKGLDRMVLTGSCGPTPILTVHGINKKSGSLGLKNRFSSRFPVFTVRPPDPVRFWKPWLKLHKIIVITRNITKSSRVKFVSKLNTDKVPRLIPQELQGIASRSLSMPHADNAFDPVFYQLYLPWTHQC